MLTLCKNSSKIQSSNDICILGFGAGFSYVAALLELKIQNFKDSKKNLSGKKTIQLEVNYY